MSIYPFFTKVISILSVRHLVHLKEPILSLSSLLGETNDDCGVGGDSLATHNPPSHLSTNCYFPCRRPDYDFPSAPYTFSDQLDWTSLKPNGPYHTTKLDYSNYTKPKPRFAHYH